MRLPVESLTQSTVVHMPRGVRSTSEPDKGRRPSSSRLTTSARRATAHMRSQGVSRSTACQVRRRPATLAWTTGAVRSTATRIGWSCPRPRLPARSTAVTTGRYVRARVRPGFHTIACQPRRSTPSEYRRPPTRTDTLEIFESQNAMRVRSRKPSVGHGYKVGTGPARLNTGGSRV